MSVTTPDGDTSASTDYWASLPEGAAPPQANGELLFEAPWQGRAFGMVHSLVDAGTFSWDEFREQLIVALDGGVASADVYYERFLLALERTLEERAGFQEQPLSALLERRIEEFASRPHGHDH